MLFIEAYIIAITSSDEVCLLL